MNALLTSTVDFPPGSFDLALRDHVLRGLRFFEDSAVAFRHMRARLVPGGCFVFTAWRSPQENAWMTRPLAVLEDLLPPMDPSDPSAPGPMRFADPDVARAALSDAGFASVDVQPLHLPLTQRGSVEELVGFMTRMGPVSRAMKLLDGSRHDEVRDRLRAMLVAEHHGEGVTHDSACWIVRAEG